jgi:hypothetical protein
LEEQKAKFNEVALLVQSEIQSDKRVVIVGKTNLPYKTELIITISDALTREPRGQFRTSVLTDGTYKSERLGPFAGLKDGEYSANVTMPLPIIQPASVRAIIGDSGQHLKGSLVNKGNNTVRSTQNFFIGGEDAAKTQVARLRKVLEVRQSLTNQIKEMANRLDQSRPLVKDGPKAAKQEKWNAFARQFRVDLITLQERFDQLDGARARLGIGSSLAAISYMFSSAAFNDDVTYREARSVYLESLMELEASLREDKLKLPKKMP